MRNEDVEELLKGNLITAQIPCAEHPDIRATHEAYHGDFQCRRFYCESCAAAIEDKKYLEISGIWVCEVCAYLVSPAHVTINPL